MYKVKWIRRPDVSRRLIAHNIQRPVSGPPRRRIAWFERCRHNVIPVPPPGCKRERKGNEMSPQPESFPHRAWWKISTIAYVLGLLTLCLVSRSTLAQSALDDSVYESPETPRDDLAAWLEVLRASATDTLSIRKRKQRTGEPHIHVIGPEKPKAPSLALSPRNESSKSETKHNRDTRTSITGRMPILRRRPDYDATCRWRLTREFGLDIEQDVLAPVLLHADKGYTGVALTLLEKTLDFLADACPRSSFFATLLVTQARACAAQGDHARASALTEHAISIVGERLNPDVAYYLDSRADLYAYRGEFNKALNLYEQSLSIRESGLGPSHVAVATSLDRLAELHQLHGRFDRATVLYHRAWRIREEALGNNHKEVVRTLVDLAMAHQSNSALAKAEWFFALATVAIDQMPTPDTSVRARCLLGRAGLLQMNGDYVNAEWMQRIGVGLMEEFAETSGLYDNRSLSILSNLLARQGRYEDAIRVNERILKRYSALLSHDHPEVASVLAETAWMRWRQGKHDEALPLAQEALMIRRRSLGAKHLEVAHSLSLLGRIFISKRDYESALLLLESAWSIQVSVQSRKHLENAALMRDIAFVRYERHEYIPALSLIESASNILTSTLGDRHVALAEILETRALILHALGRQREAIDIQRRYEQILERDIMASLSVTDDVRRLAYAAKFASQTDGTISLHLQGAKTDPDAAKLALTTLLRRKGRVQEVAAQTQAVLRRTLPVDQQHLLRDLEDIRNRLAASTRSATEEIGKESIRRQIATLERQQDDLLRRLSAHSPAVESLMDAVRISDVQLALPDESALVEFVRYRGSFAHGPGVPEARYAAYIVFPDGFDWTDLGPATAIDEKISEFNASILRRLNITASGQALHQLLMAPVAGKLRGYKRVYLAPDADLNLVSFDALVDERGRFLVESFIFYYLTTGRDLLRPWAINDPSHGPVVVVANPQGADLPGTEAEAAMIESLFEDVLLLSRSRATETRLRAQERPEILHLATHGLFGLGHPGRDTRSADHPGLRGNDMLLRGVPEVYVDDPMLYSMVQLADVRRDSVNSRIDDGFLTAYEVSGWDLRGTQLVTLSACETGRGEFHPGEGVLGFRRAFMLAGAQTLVTSLWKVSDRKTAGLMASYYEKLLAGRGRAEAMREVRLEMLHDEQTSHPHDWAAFVVVGEWEPLERSAQSHEVPETSSPTGCCLDSGRSSKMNTARMLPLLLLVVTRRRRTAKGRRCMSGEASRARGAVWGESRGRSDE